ncbi:hypothetical protein DL991_18690 [Amycolatopsis sp. WAC 01375]|uniref:hypothetical protein n=1 Tax=Amycolatopsis sp. WAC 01375 TaxID=2203194 RepID=UPI000F796492|nr:hypothetical protein [Amycolatopsis sp. WAC 01375]RSM77979.1 hypothetical protein DL991_18690 [Amycolatopsis sp. WAC 01375]
MPDPVLVSIAAAAAGRAITGLYQLIKKQFEDDSVATAVLEAAEGAAEDSAEVQDLSVALGQAEAADPDFGERIRGLWQTEVAQQADNGGVTNQVSGTVHGNVVQARDISGGISF